MLETTIVFVIGMCGLVGGLGLTTLWVIAARENGLGVGLQRVSAFIGLALFVSLIAVATPMLMFAVGRMLR